ncbi:ferredoxin [Rhizobium leguminosarum]|uniref:ferredoxin n=1 Tax=Rhizobium leguminosarum TaxID=384 RepID=UPI0024B32159|nr:ferredoxin [Rhizobium leguminosarum]WHO82628.1 ferredoxin [Rhizobium leguminosarum]
MNDNKHTVLVDVTLCEGFGVCERMERSIFQVDKNEDVVVVKRQPSTPEDLARVQLAVRRCPKQALKLIENDVE